MPSVWVYPEKKYEELGAVRWSVEWQEWKADLPDEEERDFDRDLLYYYKTFRTEASARRFAAQTWRARPLAFGVVEIQKQTVDWYVEEDGVAEWGNVGDAEHIETDAEADAADRAA